MRSFEGQEMLLHCSKRQPMTDPIKSFAPLPLSIPVRQTSPQRPQSEARALPEDQVTLKTQTGSTVESEPGKLASGPVPEPAVAQSAPPPSSAPPARLLQQAPDCVSPEAFEEVSARLATFEGGYTRSHMQETARYADGLAQALDHTALQLTPSEKRALEAASQVYDAGKLAVDEALWNDSRGPRDMPAEDWKSMWDQMCRHVDVSTEQSRRQGKSGDSAVEHAVGALSSKVAGGDDDVRQIIRHHHEKLDGTGYPDGLKGSEIPRGAQILGIADMYTALRSPRSFRPAKDHATAKSILEGDAQKGKLDPELVRIFFEKVATGEAQSN